MSDRKKPVEFLMKYLGIKEKSQQHRQLINIFNNSKLCKRYNMTDKDSWCATAVSAAFIATGLVDIFNCVECSCNEMINKAKANGIWMENDGFIPQTGDVIMYDWNDNGKGDNKGWPDHVGIVISVENGMITVIEGNKNDTVGLRNIPVDGKYIRGFITPKYKEEATTNNAPSKEVMFKGIVDAAYALNVRTWAGVENKTCSFGPLKRGTEVYVCDVVKDKNGDDWYYIKYETKHGFVSAKYIKKVG